MKIENYGKGERCREVMKRLLLLDGTEYVPESVKRITLLPIPTSRDKLHVCGTERLISEIAHSASEGDLIAGYNIPKQAAEIMREGGAKVYDAAEDEKFLTENARISAVGALAYLLTSEKREPKDLTFGIVGYGRIGRILCRLLLFLGGEVRIYTTKKENVLTLGGVGIKSVYMEGGGIIPSLEGVDVLINTAPAHLEKTFANGKLPHGMRLIELASGNNFQGVEGVEPLLSIPDKYYPKSAAKIYFKAIMTYMEDEFK